MEPVGHPPAPFLFPGDKGTQLAGPARIKPTLEIIIMLFAISRTAGLKVPAQFSGTHGGGLLSDDADGFWEPNCHLTTNWLYCL